MFHVLNAASFIRSRLVPSLAVEVRAVAAGFSPSSFLTRHFGIHPCQALLKKEKIKA